MQVAVVGAGVMGSAAARELARRGAEVDLYEQFELDHARGSSHGDARIFRISYPEAEYVALARESLPLWRELERESGQELLRNTGSLDVGPDLPHPSAMDVHGIEYEVLDEDELRARHGMAACCTPTAAGARSPRAPSGRVRGCTSGLAWTTSTRSRPTSSSSPPARG